MARIAGMFPFRRDRGEDTELFLLLDAAQKPLHAFRIVLPGRQDDHRRLEQWQRQYRRFTQGKGGPTPAASPAGCCTVSVTGL